MNAGKGLQTGFLAMLASLLIAGPVHALTPDDFETQEYRNSTGL